MYIHIKTFVIEGSHIKSLSDFYDEIETLFLLHGGFKWGRNLDAFNDVLRWWVWGFDECENIKIIWKDFEISKQHGERIDEIEEIIKGHDHIIFVKA